MIITLAGMPGSGKTTVGKLLAKKLGVPRYSIGDLRGAMAQERGLTIDELNTLGEKHAFTDKEVDAYQTKLGKSGKSFVIDGWLSWHFIPKSFKVFLDVDPKEGAKRIFQACLNRERPDERTYSSIEDAQTEIVKRLASSVKRYQKYYKVNFKDHRHYNLIVDTTKLTPNQVVTRILKAYRTQT